ncbi:MAG: NADH-quinone oxidoreductase subunit J [Planctomycetota bacterium]
MTAALFAFVAFALITVVSAFVVASHRSIVHSAFGLFFTFFGVAGLYLTLGADFVMASQILIYVGGIMVLLLFGVMLTPSRRSDFVPMRFLRALVLGAIVLVGLLWVLTNATWKTEELRPPDSTIAEIGRQLLTREEYLLPFEVASVLLLAALIGAAYLARRRKIVD